MQTTYAILLLAAQALTVFSSPSPAAAHDGDCGPLGLMNTTNLPAGVDPGAVRKCIEHPSGPIAPNNNNDNDTSVAERGLDHPLVERACWHGKAVGCTDGRCWKVCGDGPWCWTARNGGFGDWYTCSRDSDCKESYACGQAVGGCDSCGCSC